MIYELLIFGSFIAALGLCWIAPPLFHRHLQARRLGRICTNTKSIILTYDDGPGPTLTPKLLDLLAKHNANATFFVLGFRAKAHPETLNAVRQAGHEVGSHSLNHLSAWKTPPWKSIPDLLCDSWFKDLAGVEPSLVRPPYGKMILPTWLGSISRGRRILWWTTDSGDTWPTLPDAAIRAQRIIDSGGGVVLIHDFDRQDHPDRDQREAFVLALTQEILTRGCDAGFRFCRYSDLGTERAGRRDA